MAVNYNIEDCFNREASSTCNDDTKRVLRLEEASNDVPLDLSPEPSAGVSYEYARADHSHLLPEEIEKTLKDHEGHTIHEYYAPIDSPEFTGSPTAPTPTNGDNSNRLATTEYVDTAVSTIDAMLYKGVINSNSELPSEHFSGWKFRIGTAGTYALQECEVGDMIICNTTGTVYDASHWNVILANIDGAVVGPTSSVNNNIVIYDGTSGKTVKDSGKSLDDYYTKDEIDDAELTISAALNDLNSRIILLNTRIELLSEIVSQLLNS